MWGCFWFSLLAGGMMGNVSFSEASSGSFLPNSCYSVFQGTNIGFVHLPIRTIPTTPSRTGEVSIGSAHGLLALL
jgi:hypothetical protein